MPGILIRELQICSWETVVVCWRVEACIIIMATVESVGTEEEFGRGACPLKGVYCENAINYRRAGLFFTPLSHFFDSY